MTTKTFTSNLPSINVEGSLSSYLTQIKKFPMLSAEEEYMLAKSWKDRGDLKAAQKLTASQNCLVILPDSIRNYLSKFVDDNWMQKQGFTKS